MLVSEEQPQIKTPGESGHEQAEYLGGIHVCPRTP